MVEIDREVIRLLESVVRRLDVIIGVLLRAPRPEGEKPSVREMVRVLSEAELRPSEIARILGITPLHVSVTLHEIRKKEKKSSVEIEG